VQDSIRIRGARVHNLKNISLDIPHNRLTVITGVSGSGKSSLAFDTVYAEGQRRYVESLSAYARQFLERMEKPDVDDIDGIAPAVAIRQKNTTRNPRSTVATSTECYDFLRLLYARVGRTFCPNCGTEVRRDSVDEAAARLNRLVGNLLDVTRLGSGHVQPKLDWCDVADLVHVTVHGLESVLAGRDVKIELAPELPLVRLDFALMQQALANLLLNAAVHTPPGTPVVIQVTPEPGWLTLTVADRGPGLPPDLGERVFDKFVRAPNAPAGGSGLGLAIVKGFVEAQGGRISAANRPGGGALFAIRILQTEKPPNHE